MTSIQSGESTFVSPSLHNHDKLNNVDFKWYVVRSLTHQERKLAELFQRQKEITKNILEVYCPTHTTVSMSQKGKSMQVPLFAGFVFVLSTQKVISGIMERYYPQGTILYDKSKKHGREPRCLTIPEEQMRAFMDFNENYSDKVIILERPYTDYAFNPKTNEPNEIVKIVDGPLAGRKGYLTRFKRDKRLVFNMKAFGSDRYFAVSIPNVWSLKVVRLHNAANDRQSVGTLKERAADLLIGMIQSCGYGAKTLQVLYEITGFLSATPTIVGLCQYLSKQGHEKLSQGITKLNTNEAELVLNLVRYEKDNPGYVKSNFSKLVIRPFLTPTSGVEFKDVEEEEVELKHEYFIETIRRTHITELTFYPDKHKDEPATTTYFAHIGMMTNENNDGVILFTNWDVFLGEYFMTAGKANEKLVDGTTETVVDKEYELKKGKLIESFRNYAPTLYNVLTDVNSRVKAIRSLKVGGERLNVLAVETQCKDIREISEAKNELLAVCTDICKEINSTVHLAVWRRYLRTVWLHI